jgi:hypothetical protein
MLMKQLAVDRTRSSPLRVIRANAALRPVKKEANAIRTSMPASKKRVHIAPQYD